MAYFKELIMHVIVDINSQYIYQIPFLKLLFILIKELK
jgi:hypothetical protein